MFSRLSSTLWLLRMTAVFITVGYIFKSVYPKKKKKKEIGIVKQDGKGKLVK